MPVCAVSAPVAFLGAATNSDRFLVDLLFVVQEGEIVKGVGMSWLELHATLQVFNGLGIGFDLKVSQTQIVLGLCVLLFEERCLFQSKD